MITGIALQEPAARLLPLKHPTWVEMKLTNPDGPYNKKLVAERMNTNGTTPLNIHPQLWADSQAWTIARDGVWDFKREMIQDAGPRDQRDAQLTGGDGNALKWTDGTGVVRTVAHGILPN